MLVQNSNDSEISRRSFLVNATIFLTALTGIESFLSACGETAGAFESEELTEGNCQSNGTLVSIEVAHTPNHTLIVPKEDVVIGKTKAYILTNNGSGHIHEVTLSAEDFCNLWHNQGITKISTRVFGHTHFVTVKCI